MVEARQDVRDSSRSWPGCVGRTNTRFFASQKSYQDSPKASGSIHRFRTRFPTSVLTFRLLRINQLPFGMPPLTWLFQRVGCLSPSETQTEEKWPSCFPLSTTHLVLEDWFNNAEFASFWLSPAYQYKVKL